MRGSPPPLWFCPRHWLQTTPKTTATWATSNSFPLPAKPAAFGGRSRRARRSVLCRRQGFTDSRRKQRHGNPKPFAHWLDLGPCPRYGKRGRPRDGTRAKKRGAESTWGGNASCGAEPSSGNVHGRDSG